MVVYDSSPACVRALPLATQLAQADDQSVTILLAANDPPVVRRLRAESDEQLAGTKVAAQDPVLPSPDAVAMARAVRAAMAGTLLMAADSPVFDGATRCRLLGDLVCAALLTL